MSGLGEDNWTRLSTEAKLSAVDGWLGKAELNEATALSPAIEDSLELGVKGSKEWRCNMIDGLSSAMSNYKQYGLLSANGKLEYSFTDWMQIGELVWVLTPQGWWPAQIEVELTLSADVSGDKADKTAEKKPEDKEKVWVKPFSTKDRVAVRKNAATLLPFRVCFDKLSLQPPHDPKFRDRWTAALKAAEEAEERRLQNAVDEKLSTYESRLKDFAPEPVAQRHLTTFVRNRTQLLLEALLHEYLDKHPDIDITAEEQHAREAEEKLQLRDALQKVLELFTKDLFMYLHQQSDESCQGDLVNLWQRLSHTEKGILTAKQVASVLMRLLDRELVERTVLEFSGDTNMRPRERPPAQQTEKSPVKDLQHSVVQPQVDSAQKQHEMVQPEKQDHNQSVSWQRQCEIRRRLGHQKLSFEHRLSLRNYAAISRSKAV